MAIFGWFTKRRRDRIAAEPFPEAWRPILEERVPFYRRLGPEERRKLEQHVAIFLAEKPIEGCGGLELTDEIRVTIAADACILLLGREHDFYPDLDVIRVYPSAYVAPAVRSEAGVIVERLEARAGESWTRGVVVLAWDHVAGVEGDGQNVVFHEFAHQLDQEDGPVDGAPALPSRARYVAWARVLGDEFAELSKELDEGHRTLIRAYGATSPPEFFAVVTELFFEKPAQLLREHPALYAQLRDFYGQDPAA